MQVFCQFGSFSLVDLRFYLVDMKFLTNRKSEVIKFQLRFSKESISCLLRINI